MNYRCVRTYTGHRQAIRDVDFNNSGDHFLSTSYDRYIKLWDTETGECVNRFTNNKVRKTFMIFNFPSRKITVFNLNRNLLHDNTKCMILDRVLRKIQSR